MSEPRDGYINRHDWDRGPETTPLLPLDLEKLGKETVVNDIRGAAELLRKERDAIPNVSYPEVLFMIRRAMTGRYIRLLALAEKLEGMECPYFWENC